MCDLLYPTGHENRSPYPVVSRGALGRGQMGAWPECPIPSGAAWTDYSDGLGWRPQSGHRPATGHVQAHGAAVERAISGASIGGPGKRCPSCWSYPTHLRAQSPGRRRGHAAHDTAGRHPLEYADHGQGPRPQRGDGSAYLQATWPSLMSPALAGGFFTIVPPGKPHLNRVG